MERAQRSVETSRSGPIARAAPSLVVVQRTEPEPTIHLGVASRIDALDGLRAVSILIVLFAHSAQTLGAPALLRPLGDLGVLGVELFFAISGFIITLLLIRERCATGRIDLKGFWQRRAWRILPPFFGACVGLWFAASAGVFHWSWSSFLGAATFTKNTQLFAGGWFFGHFWSLSLEEQFYLVWPVVFFFVRTLRGLAVMLTAVIAAGPIVSVLATPATEWSLPFVPMLASGCLVAVLMELRPRWISFLRQLPWMRVALLCITTLVAIPVAYCRHRILWPSVSIPLNALIVPLLTILVLMETVYDEGVLRRPLTHAAMTWLGRISYSVYLWQQLFMGSPGAYSEHWRFKMWPLNILLAIACGALAYLLVERPVQRLRVLAQIFKQSKPAQSRATSSAFLTRSEP